MGKTYIADSFKTTEGIDLVTEALMKGGYVGTAESLKNLIVSSVTGVTGISITPADAPTGTGIASWVALQAGVYTNFGGKIVNAGSIAVISRDALNIFSISQTPFDITSKVNVSDVVNNLTSTETAKPLSAAQGKALNEKIAKGIVAWTATAFASGYQVNHLGKDWVSNAAIVAGDVPGTSSKWVERLTGYATKITLSNRINQINKSVFESKKNGKSDELFTSPMLDNIGQYATNLYAIDSTAKVSAIRAKLISSVDTIVGKLNNITNVFTPITTIVAADVVTGMFSDYYIEPTYLAANEFICVKNNIYFSSTGTGTASKFYYGPSTTWNNYANGSTSFAYDVYYSGVSVVEAQLLANVASNSSQISTNTTALEVLNNKILLKAVPTGALTAYTTVASNTLYFGNKFGYIGKVSGINVFIVDKTVQLDIYKINTLTPSGFTLIKTVLSANLVNGLNVINFDATINLLKNEEIVLKGRYGYTTTYHTIVAFSATANSISNNTALEIGYSLICASDKLDQYSSKITTLESIAGKLPLTCTLFGDSITENLGQTGAPYDNMVIRKFSEFSIITSVTNAGHQGHYLSGGGLYSLIQYATAITVFPKLVIVMAGTNDFGTSKALGTVNDDYTVSDATMCAGLKKILDHFTTGGSKVLFCTTPPRESETTNNGLGLNLRKYINAAKDVCYLPQYYKKVWVLDYFTLCGYKGADEVDGSRYYTSDGLHLTYAGYESLTTAQANFIKTSMLNAINNIL